jgi:prevent-host-death family protein
MKFDFAKDIKPISDMRAHATALVKQVQASTQPLVMTQNGRSVAVLVDLEGFQRVCDEWELFRAIAQGEHDIVEGNVCPHHDVMQALKERLP